MAASVRVSGPPNSSFLVGYPGISATLVRLAPRLAPVRLRLRAASPEAEGGGQQRQPVDSKERALTANLASTAADRGKG